MNSTENHTSKNPDELFESLFANAASRTKPPGDEEDRIREQLHGQWLEMTGARRRRRWFSGLAVAASIVLVSVVSIGVFNQSAGPLPATLLASVDKTDGRVTLVSADGSSQAVQDDGSLQSGSMITTAYNARVALRWRNGESIRLDENSRIRLKSATEIELLTGRIYIDSHADPAISSGGNSLSINTSFGSVRHIGTQYITSLTQNLVAVSVRQGSVLIMESDKETVANPGQQLSISSNGEINLSAINTYGEIWRWVEEISPDFVLDEHSLADFLDWVSSESGHALIYDSAMAETLAADTIMHGTVNLQPMRALQVMLQTSDLVAKVENGKIIVNTL